jgi:hypothetical protein
MQALILAGGKGTRLRPLTVYTPKPVVPICNRPFLLYQIDTLRRAGITDITLSLSYQPSKIEQLLGDKAEFLLNFKNPKISAERLHLPGPDVVDRLYAVSDRNNRVLSNLQRLVTHGLLGGTGYLSILPVDQGIEHSAGASFAPNPAYFDSENIVKLAIEGGCNAVASTIGVLGAVSRRYAHRIPFIVKINHNELLVYPNLGESIPKSKTAQLAFFVTAWPGKENTGAMQLTLEILQHGRALRRYVETAWPHFDWEPAFERSVSELNDTLRLMLTEALHGQYE